ncbi:HNH endonuclease [Corynebacterium sp. zg-331]|nr:HNH endonuclease [Corynebacterium sp. zg-331]
MTVSFADEALDTALAHRLVLDTPCYLCAAPEDPMARRYMSRNKEDLALWEAMVPDLEEDEFSQVVESLAPRMGCSPASVRHHIYAAAVLHKLPRLYAKVAGAGLLDMDRVVGVALSLRGVPEEHWAAVDAHLSDYLTPQVPMQVLPSRRAIVRRLRSFVDSLLPNFYAREAPRRVLRHGEGLSRFDLRLPRDQAHAVYQALAAIARREDCCLSEALFHLATQAGEFRVTLHLFGDGTGPVHMVGAGDLVAAQGRFWARRITHRRDLSTVRESIGHDPSEVLAVAVRLRDGGCRYPGCSAQRTELHHVIEYEVGGPTALTNLACLCRKHHNMLTFDEARMFMTHSGVCRWTFRDGTTLATLPEGPLARPRYATWSYNWGHYLRRRYQEIRSSVEESPVSGSTRPETAEASSLACFLPSSTPH